MKYMMRVGLACLVFLLTGLGCDFTQKITFGFWEDTSVLKLDKVQDVFTPQDTLSCMIPFGSEIGTTSIKFQLTKKDAAMMIQSWDDDVDPETEVYYYKFWMPDPNDEEADFELEPGQYTLNVYKKDVKIASGSFTIK